jgi:hypothetical protein
MAEADESGASAQNSKRPERARDIPVFFCFNGENLQGIKIVNLAKVLELIAGW